MLKVTRNETPARSVLSKCPDLIAIRRLPSHGLRFGLPPKLHGHEIVQLQLSATVAVTCQFGAAARGGAEVAVTIRTTAISRLRMPGSLSQPSHLWRALAFFCGTAARSSVCSSFWM